jgi:hypothetical protein
MTAARALQVGRADEGQQNELARQKLASITQPPESSRPPDPPRPGPRPIRRRLGAHMRQVRERARRARHQLSAPAGPPPERQDAGEQVHEAYESAERPAQPPGDQRRATPCTGGLTFRSGTSQRAPRREVPERSGTTANALPTGINDAQPRSIYSEGCPVLITRIRPMVGHRGTWTIYRVESHWFRAGTAVSAARSRWPSDVLERQSLFTITAMRRMRRPCAPSWIRLAVAALPSKPISPLPPTEADWDRHIAVNLKAAFLLTQAVLPGLRARYWGRIINLSSTAAQVGGIVGPHYAAARAGLLGLTHAYAALLAKEGITVNAIAPALIETQMLASLPKAQPERIPVGRFGTVEEVAEVALMLACNGYVTGQTIQVNGGVYMT